MKKYTLFLRPLVVIAIMTLIIMALGALYLDVQSVWFVIAMYLGAIVGLQFWLVVPRITGRIKIYKGEQRAQLLTMAKKVKVKLRNIYVRKSKHANAAAMGFGFTRAVVLWSPLTKFPAEEIEGVFAHELGHHYYGDSLKGTLSYMTAFNITSIIMPFIYDPNQNTISLYVIIALIMAILAYLPLSYLSRMREWRADAFAKNMLDDPHKLSHFLSHVVKDYEKNGITIPAKPPFLLRFLGTHPWIRERIAYLEKK